MGNLSLCGMHGCILAAFNFCPINPIQTFLFLYINVYICGI